MYVLVTYRDEENQMKMKVLEWSQHSNSFKLLWKAWLPTNEEDPFKMKGLEWSQQISHCKSVQIFYDAQGKLTPQSKVGSTLN